LGFGGGRERTTNLRSRNREKKNTKPNSEWKGEKSVLYFSFGVLRIVKKKSSVDQDQGTLY